jgi:hypothetical protein
MLVSLVFGWNKTEVKGNISVHERSDIAVVETYDETLALADKSRQRN